MTRIFFLWESQENNNTCPFATRKLFAQPFFGCSTLISEGVELRLRMGILVKAKEQVGWAPTFLEGKTAGCANMAVLLALDLHAIYCTYLAGFYNARFHDPWATLNLHPRLRSTTQPWPPQSFMLPQCWPMPMDKLEMPCCMDPPWSAASSSLHSSLVWWALRKVRAAVGCVILVVLGIAIWQIGHRTQTVPNKKPHKHVLVISSSKRPAKTLQLVVLSRSFNLLFESFRKFHIFHIFQLPSNPQKEGGTSRFHPSKTFQDWKKPIVPGFPWWDAWPSWPSWSLTVMNTIENHHFSWENSLFLWPFSIAFCMFTRPGNSHGNFTPWHHHGTMAPWRHGIGLTLSMGLYSVYVLLFAVAAQLCDRRNDSNGACVVGNTYQLPVNLAGAVSYSGDREPK